MKMIDFVKAVIIFWALVFIIMALAHAQTPSCVGKHTAREQCACMGWCWNEKLKMCWEPGWIEGVSCNSEQRCDPSRGPANPPPFDSPWELVGGHFAVSDNLLAAGITERKTASTPVTDPCGLPAVLHANGKCYQSYTVTKPSSKAVCVYADHGQTATIKCSWKAGGK